MSEADKTASGSKSAETSCYAGIEAFFEKMRFSKSHLGLGDIRLTLAQQQDICDDTAFFIEQLKGAFNYIANEIQDNPDDSIRDILNDAFLGFNLPFIADKEYNILDFDWSKGK